ncbi:MAG: hypothetical protein KBE65_17075 [Phycisphaerae bacterium]|nr:hypothetical protein [Phycisphaerae bacterium]
MYQLVANQSVITIIGGRHRSLCLFHHNKDHIVASRPFTERTGEYYTAVLQVHAITQIGDKMPVMPALHESGEGVFAFCGRCATMLRLCRPAGDGDATAGGVRVAKDKIEEAGSLDI